MDSRIIYGLRFARTAEMWGKRVHGEPLVGDWESDALARASPSTLAAWQKRCLSNSPMRKWWSPAVTHIFTHVVGVALVRCERLLTTQTGPSGI